MSWKYRFLPAINLYVKDRIQEADADRQRSTAESLLLRLETMPGQILADEVGMGKTFVALAVAVSVALQDKAQRPVVIMIPPGLKEKWPKDLGVFLERCLDEKSRAQVRWGIAGSNVEFLKLLDDDPVHRHAGSLRASAPAPRGHRDGREIDVSFTRAGNPVIPFK